MIDTLDTIDNPLDMRSMKRRNVESVYCVYTSSLVSQNPHLYLVDSQKWGV